MASSPDQPDHPVRAALHALRLSAGLTQAQVGERMGSGQGEVSKIERGKRDVRLDTLHRYARAVGAELTFTITILEP